MLSPYFVTLDIGSAERHHWTVSQAAHPLLQSLLQIVQL